MKQAIAYIRISDKDQSNFSTSGQERYIREHCERNQIRLLDIFTDDGRSAKNFDRPNWMELERFIKTHSNIDYLVVVKYDRFSRNTAQGLQKIEMLEKKFGIIIISVFEQMFVDSDSPYFFKQRADMLVTAEFEWHVIRDRTRFGMHEALASGRYVSKAPFGYKNTSDSVPGSRKKKNARIVIDETKAPIVQKIFAQYLDGLPFISIAKEARQNGLNVKGRSAIPRILGNPLYAGLVHVPAYRKEPAKYVKGIHDGLIPEQMWWQIQQQLGNVPRVKNILNDAVHLRGVLNCFCGKALTAGKSKGKLKHYWYYKCNVHPKSNFSASKLHTQFDQVLDYFSFNKLQLTYLHEQAEKEMNLQLNERLAKKETVERDLKLVTAQIHSLEEKFITGQIQSETYQRWFTTYKSKQVTLQYEQEKLNSDHRQLWKRFNDNLPRLSDIKFLYHSATLLERHTFIRQVFNWGLTYFEGSYRTPDLQILFRHNELILNEKRLLIIEKPLAKTGENSISAPNVTIVEHLAKFIDLIDQIKIA